MTSDLKTVDPIWAWSPFEPSDDQPWNRALAAHLYRRAGFGANWSQLRRATESDPADIVEQLLQPGDEAAKFESEMQSLDDVALAAGNVEGLPGWWLYRMLHTPDPLLEKLSLFWHGHFATSAAKVLDIRLMYEQHQLFREHARGKFAPLVHGIARDPAMLIYLDSDTNRKTHPNENFARELMELFCLGTGAYTEQDIRELARTFTGWEVHRKRFVFNEYEHDPSRKSILGRSGNFGGEEGVEIVLAQEATPRFLARKLFRFFVCDEPAPPDALIEPLAQDLRKSDFNIGQIVRTILSSQLFFSEHAVGKKVRSPVELGIGLLRALESQGNMHQLGQKLTNLGQRLFYPPSVKGWDGGRTWINSATLVGRGNLVRDVVRSADVAPLPVRAGAQSPKEIVDWALELLVAVPIPDDVRTFLTELVSRKLGDQQRIAGLLHAVGCLPEFQLN